MIRVAPGSSFEARVEAFPTGLTGTVRVRLLNNTGGTTFGPTTAGIVEDPAGSGSYVVTLAAPTETGEFTVFWDTGTVSPTTTATEELIVSVIGPTPIDAATSFESRVQGFPSGLVGTVRVQIVDNIGATVLAPRTTGIIEDPAGSGSYVTTLTAPAVSGHYSVVWDTGAGTRSATEDILVGAASTAAAGDLTTIARARIYLRRQSVVDEAQDTLLQMLISAYSDAIHRYTERQFRPKAPATDVEQPVTRRFSYDGRGVLSLVPYELRSLGGAGYGGTGGIVLGTDLPTASQQSLVAQTATVESDYRLEPRNGTPEGTYYWLRLPTVSLNGSGRRLGREVTITGYWGVNAVPADVELACLRAVANSFRNPEGHASRSLGDFSLSEVPEDPDTKVSLPLDARALLRPYMRAHV